MTIDQDPLKSNRREFLKAATAAMTGAALGDVARDLIRASGDAKSPGYEIGAPDSRPIIEAEEPLERLGGKVFIQGNLRSDLDALSSHIIFDKETGALRVLDTNARVIAEYGTEPRALGSDGKKAPIIEVQVKRVGAAIRFSYILPDGDSEYVDVYRRITDGEFEAFEGAISIMRQSR